MKTIFADSGYWIAILNPRDSLHEIAIEVSKNQGPFHTVTSEMVLAEVLNFMCREGPNVRRAAGVFTVQLRKNPNVTIMPQTSMLFQKALGLYQEREDKNWSLTDCASFMIMRENALTEALTHDDHFEQAGFTALLRGP
jgi:predicted nucleic acid-binding protein